MQSINIYRNWKFSFICIIDYFISTSLTLDIALYYVFDNVRVQPIYLNNFFFG